MKSCLANVVTTPCHQQLMCSECVSHGHCLWCASIGGCVDHRLYPYAYPYGQCLGWNRTCNGDEESTCPGNITATCSSYDSCSQCGDDVNCGWCDYPEGTGRGACAQGGFTLPTQSCPINNSTWFFTDCPLCNCNGHSTCVNESICSNCSDLTTGPRCEYCSSGYYGNVINGGSCTECFCNGYGDICANRTGVCSCNQYGVGGDHCDICVGGTHDGNPDNYCYYPMMINFVYTFEISQRYIETANFVAVPSKQGDISFEMEILTYNTSFDLYLYSGRVSTGLLLSDNLSNVSGPYHVSRSLKFTIKNGHWDKDVGLLLYIEDMNPPVTFRITLKQTNYLFLLFFFAAFCICFLTLLLCFLLIWYIRNKLARRRYIQAHRAELTKRMKRPFANMQVIVDKKPTLEKQRASCMCVEPCSDGKAAVLSLLIQLPGDSPGYSQSGLCVGTTLVRSLRTTSDNKHWPHRSTNTRT